MAIHSVDLAIGLIAVIWLAGRRFNTPRPVRTYTTALRYFWGSAAYVVTGAALYVLLHSLLARAVDLRDTAALGALVLTGLAVRLPGASRADRWLRQKLQRLIGYPAEAHRLASTLSVAPFVPAAAVRDEVRFVLQGRGYDLDNGWLPVAEPVRDLWFRAAALFQQVLQWERDPRFGSFASTACDEFAVLRQRFDQLSLKVVRVLETIEQIGGLWIRADAKPRPAEGTPKPAQSDEAQQQFRTELRAIVSRLLADLREDVAFFYRNLCLFVARGIFTECVWARRRQRELAKLGFDLPPRERARTMLVLASVFLFYFVAFLLALTGKVGGLLEELPRIAMIALVQALAVGVAVVPKQLFGFANENLRGRTPWGFVLGAGFGAVLVALPVQIAFAAVWVDGGDWTDVFRRLIPWLAMPFAAASSLAFLVQDGRWARVDSSTGRRLADVLVLVCTFGLAVCAARGMQYLMADRVWALETAVRDAWLIAVIAVGIGAMVPNTFRHPLARGGSPPPERAHAPPALEAPGRGRLRAQARLARRKRADPGAAGPTRNVPSL
ncbi:MAG: hypothetical protein ACREVP_09280 [Burkholderiales bacterium]